MKCFLLVIMMLMTAIFPVSTTKTSDICSGSGQFFAESYVADLCEVDNNEPLDCELDPIYESVLSVGNISAEEVFPEVSVLQSTTTVAYDTFMEAYFRGLRKNFGENYKGSCGYVALGELLSYYDTYLSDYFIDETYDIASTGSGTDMVTRALSPGILNDTISSSEYSAYGKTSVSALTASEYYEIIATKANISLHAKLITIGKSLGYYDSTDNSSPCGTSITSRVNILKQYFAEIGLSEEFYTIRTYSSGTSSNVEAWIKSEIDKGNPVIASIYSSSRNAAHACVLYDYDDSTVYGNMGWSSSTSYAHYSAMSRYDTYRNAMVIDFDFGHEHSLNYEVTDSGVTTDYCYCNCNIYTYKYIGHAYTDYYIDCEDNATHKSYCRCGDYIVEKHSWNNISLLADTLPYKLACEQCGAFKSSGGGGTVFSVSKEN